MQNAGNSPPSGHGGGVKKQQIEQTLEMLFKEHSVYQDTGSLLGLLTCISLAAHEHKNAIPQTLTTELKNLLKSSFLGIFDAASLVEFVTQRGLIPFLQPLIPTQFKQVLELFFASHIKKENFQNELEKYLSSLRQFGKMPIEQVGLFLRNTDLISTLSKDVRALMNQLLKDIYSTPLRNVANPAPTTAAPNEAKGPEVGLSPRDIILAAANLSSAPKVDANKNASSNKVPDLSQQQIRANYENNNSSNNGNSSYYDSSIHQSTNQGRYQEKPVANVTQPNSDKAPHANNVVKLASLAEVSPADYANETPKETNNLRNLHIPQLNLVKNQNTAQNTSTHKSEMTAGNAPHTPAPTEMNPMADAVQAAAAAAATIVQAAMQSAASQQIQQQGPISHSVTAGQLKEHNITTAAGTINSGHTSALGAVHGGGLAPGPEAIVASSQSAIAALQSAVTASQAAVAALQSAVTATQAAIYAAQTQQDSNQQQQTPPHPQRPKT